MLRLPFSLPIPRRNTVMRRAGPADLCPYLLLESCSMSSIARLSSIIRPVFSSCVFSFALIGLLWNEASTAELTTEQSKTGVKVLIDGKLFTEYLFRSGSKPVLWPVIGPHGIEMTRAYPFKEIKGDKTDHIHHRSIWFTHGNVNGTDFWLEVAKDRKGGTIEQRDISVKEGNGKVQIESTNDWMTPQRKKVLEDKRVMTFGVDGENRVIDFDITLTAGDEPAVIGETKEGSFGIRVPHVMSVDAKQGGKIINSRGQKDGDAWGKPAEWVDYHGAVKDEQGKSNHVGIAVLNHPSSFRAPTHWHVRTYGLFAANPFGLHDFDKNQPEGAGAVTLKPHDSLTLRYRVIFHAGDEQQAGIAAAYEKYAK